MWQHTKDPIHDLEIQEIIEKLNKHGYGKIVDCLLSNESKCFTKKGRLNKSSTSKLLGIKSKVLEQKLFEMREVLAQEFGEDIVEKLNNEAKEKKSQAAKKKKKASKKPKKKSSKSSKKKTSKKAAKKKDVKKKVARRKRKS